MYLFKIIAEYYKKIRNSKEVVFLLHRLKISYDAQTEGHSIPLNRKKVITYTPTRSKKIKDERIGTDFKHDKYYIEDTDKERNEIFSYDYRKAKTEKVQFFWVSEGLTDNDRQAIEQYNDNRKSNRIKESIFEKIKPYFRKGLTAEAIGREIGASASTVQRYTKRIKDANPAPVGFSFDKTD